MLVRALIKIPSTLCDATGTFAVFDCLASLNRGSTRLRGKEVPPMPGGHFSLFDDDDGRTNGLQMGP